MTPRRQILSRKRMDNSGRAHHDRDPRRELVASSYRSSNRRSFTTETAPSSGGMVHVDRTAAGKFSLGLRSPRSEPFGGMGGVEEGKRVGKNIRHTWSNVFPAPWPQSSGGWVAVDEGNTVCLVIAVGYPRPFRRVAFCRERKGQVSQSHTNPLSDPG